MASIGEQITKVALDHLKREPDGLRYAELVRRIIKSNPSFKANTVHGTVWDLDKRLPKRVCKPSRGLFRLVEYRDSQTDQIRDELVAKPPKEVREEGFYKPFAEWLQKDVEECTKAISLGGKKFKDKWGTPDVIGKRESKQSDIIQFPLEIVSAEVKGEVSQSVTAFGQACAYCLFSHKSYLVIPQQAPQDETARLDSLCQVFGIGLVLFDAGNPEDPSFSIRVRPRRQDPDLFYANKYMKLIEDKLFG